jgi:hypothetical protein|tara:strand:- start:406 stop:579 length:174 start_codon:yes stop_codon:yes gene_type:complete
VKTGDLVTNIFSEIGVLGIIVAISVDPFSGISTPTVAWLDGRVQQARWEFLKRVYKK